MFVWALGIVACKLGWGTFKRVFMCTRYILIALMTLTVTVTTRLAFFTHYGIEVANILISLVKTMRVAVFLVIVDQ